MSRPTGFFAGTLRASLPLWLWAAHFAICYGSVATGCHAGWHQIELAGLSLLLWMLALASLLALALSALLLRTAWREAAAAGPAGGLYRRVHVLAATLALIGITWTSVPLLWLPVCHATPP